MAQEYRDPRLKDGRVFCQVNKMFITLNDDDMKGYNKHFIKILNKLIDMMKSQDPFFQATFQEIFYAGSYYDRLKVGKPEEFDLDLIIKLPVDYSKIEFHEEQDRPGYLKLKMNAILPDLRKHPRWSECYRVMDDWVDNDSYLNQSKFRQWMEGVVSRALHGLESAGNGGFVLLDRTDDVSTRYVLSTKKSGPAFTLCILEPSGKKIDVDLVPVLEFKTPPPPSFRKLNDVEPYWLAVPKPLEGEKK